MNSDSKKALAANIHKLITSLAEIALDEGMSHSEFAELSRFAFVRAAERVLHNENRITDSRVSILTGIHRKDVKRLREQDAESFSAEKAKTNRAIAVISAWTREGDYCDSKGNPQPLSYDNEAPSLSTLIQTHSGDMPVRAVVDELERLGVIQEKDNLWYLTVPAYVPDKSRETVFGFLGDDTSRLIETIYHNLNTPPRKRRFQRSVAYDELSPESVELFQALASEKSMQLLKEFDSWLAKREKLDKLNRKNDPAIPAKKAGVGIYYFEEKLTDKSAGEDR